VVSIDWVGSGNRGGHNISDRRAVVAVSYSAANHATSTVNGCSEQQSGAATGAPAAASTHSFHVGSRDNLGYDRYFKGTLHGAAATPIFLWILRT